MTNNTRSLTGRVYFIRAGDAIKIGFSAEPESRLNYLQTSNSEELELLGSVSTRTMTEREAHDRFADLYIRGEWFRAEGHLLEFVQGLPRPLIEKPEPRRLSRRRPVPTHEMRHLMALRSRHGAETAIGCRCSNLLGQLDSLQSAEGERREQLLAFMKKQTDDLGRLLAA